ncbi:histidine phosphotransferase family protein [Planktotalea sp.]|uniref:histidine phosphotransferase family protein n=1 Tax=Planktotalea sp. TaxID=2029877 RepID=UPI0025D09F6D|nr:histidine phosphotransferase family protein [Planktotalea sp.]
MQCVEQALPYGGQVTISHTNGRWQLDLVSERFLIDPDLWSYFEAGSKDQKNHADTIPAHVQFLLLPMHANAQGRRVAFSQNDASVNLLV